jgi:hypothetical protein
MKIFWEIIYFWYGRDIWYIEELGEKKEALG